MAGARRRERGEEHFTGGARPARKREAGTIYCMSTTVARHADGKYRSGAVTNVKPHEVQPGDVIDHPAYPGAALRVSQAEPQEDGTVRLSGDRLDPAGLVTGSGDTVVVGKPQAHAGNSPVAGRVEKHLHSQFAARIEALELALFSLAERVYDNVMMTSEFSGTSEGAKKGWETRGGGGEDKSAADGRAKVGDAVAVYSTHEGLEGAQAGKVTAVDEKGITVKPSFDQGEPVLHVDHGDYTIHPHEADALAEADAEYHMGNPVGPNEAQRGDVVKMTPEQKDAYVKGYLKENINGDFEVAHDAGMRAAAKLGGPKDWEHIGDE